MPSYCFSSQLTRLLIAVHPLCRWPESMTLPYATFTHQKCGISYTPSVNVWTTWRLFLYRRESTQCSVRVQRILFCLPPYGTLHRMQTAGGVCKQRILALRNCASVTSRKCTLCTKDHRHSKIGNFEGADCGIEWCCKGCAKGLLCRANGGVVWWAILQQWCLMVRNPKSKD